MAAAGTRAGHGDRPLARWMHTALVWMVQALRTSSLLGVAGASGACVLPVAPEFEAEPNRAPFLVSAEPAVGTHTKVQEGDPRFAAIVEDPNGDVLYVRQIVDYPPYVPELSRYFEPPPLPPAPGERVNRATIAFSPNCFTISPAETQHRAMIVISDRPFLRPEDSPNPEQRLDATPPEALVLKLVWSFEIPCRLR